MRSRSALSTGQFDLGINLFDTANNYGAGRSEAVLGQALAGRRQQVVISTKFATVFDEAANMVYFNRELDINGVTMGSLEGSLRRLGTDYLDMYLLHHGQYTIRESACGGRPSGRISWRGENPLLRLEH